MSEPKFYLTNDVLLNDGDEDTILKIKNKYENIEKISILKGEESWTSEEFYTRARALVAGLIILTLCHYMMTKENGEISLDATGQVLDELKVVSTAGRVAKPVVKMVVSYGLGSAVITAGSSLLLVMAVMFRTYSLRFLAVPLMLMTGMELVGDAADSLVATLVLGSRLGPGQAVTYLAASALLIALEAVLWLAVVEFYHQQPPDNSIPNDDKVEAKKPFFHQE